MYNIIKGPNGSTIIEVAVPGKTRDQILVTLNNGLLKVDTKSSETPTYLYKGIPDFEPIFFKAINDKVDLASLNNGILSILLSRNLTDNGTIEIQ